MKSDTATKVQVQLLVYVYVGPGPVTGTDAGTGPFTVTVTGWFSGRWVSESHLNPAVPLRSLSKPSNPWWGRWRGRGGQRRRRPNSNSRWLLSPSSKGPAASGDDQALLVRPVKRFLLRRRQSRRAANTVQGLQRWEVKECGLNFFGGQIWISLKVNACISDPLHLWVTDAFGPVLSAWNRQTSKSTRAWRFGRVQAGVGGVGQEPGVS